MKRSLGVNRKLAMGMTAVAVFSSVMQAALTPCDLRVDGRTEIFAASATPRLTWRVKSDARTQAQSAWQLMVASSAELLAKDQGDLADTGKEAADGSPWIVYSGKPLMAGKRYFWKVRCWDDADQVSPWSETAVMEIAPMTPADWRGAKWIDDGRDNPADDKDFYLPDPAPLMRKEFAINKPITRARLHVAGPGYVLPSLNGKRLADAPLDPPWTAFDKRILFRTHDVTAALGEGKQCLGLALGNGWFNPLPLRMWGHRNIRGSMAVGRPRAIACLVIDHADGSQTTITTGPDWQVATGPTTRNSVYLGEERDARLTPDGWDKPGFDAASWKSVRVSDAPLETLKPLLDMPPVREIETFPAASVKTLKEGLHIVDFGVNFTGVPAIDLNVPEGTKITLRFGEILNADGTLNPMTSVCGQIKGMRKNDKGEENPIGGPGAPAIAWQQDVCIARGGKETYRPDFTFHAFRYMEISGLTETPRVETIRGIRLHSALPDAGSFSCSNELLNRIQKITRNTFVNNVISVQSDCPHRERFGYGGDIAVTSEAYMMNYDMSGFYAKTIRDWADGARPDGNFTDTAPFVGVQYCGVGWAMAHPLLLEQHYQHYGDVSLIREQLPAAIRWFELEASKRKNGLVTYGLGDHEAFKRLGGAPVTTPMFIDTARRMARLCRILQQEKDAVRFEEMAMESAVAWRKEFFDAKTGNVGGGTQSELLLALGFGSVEETDRKAVFDRLVADVMAQPDGPSLTTGIFGTRFLLEQLSQRGRHDLAFALANRTKFPSWGHMLENGATTLWETWKQSDNTFSHNHPMFGSVSAWFYRHLGGIQVMDGAVGANQLLIRPQPVGDVTWVKCSHRSIRGMIESNWNIGAARSDFDIVIPPDTTAIIELPKKIGDVVTESGKAIAEAEGVGSLPDQSVAHRFKVSSGQYRFRIEHKP
jgi:alpha-L-rhamnosidase